MEMIRVPQLLAKYRTWVNSGDIQFLAKGSRDQKQVLSFVDELLNDVEAASKKPGGLSSNLNWFRTHEKGKRLWQKLASCSLDNIDPGAKGKSELFEFLDAATEFEDLLYGLEPYYRDHTLHSLWVYLIGEHVMRELLPDVHRDLNWYLFNDIESDPTEHSPQLRKLAKKQEQLLCRKVSEKRDSIWCLMALCHDLGYSLAHLEGLNEKTQKVLKFFAIPEFRRIGYSLDIEHQYVMSQFLELMAMDVRIVPTADKKDWVVKCYRDDSTYWRLCRALEKKKHGILSSYLIYKILGIFADAWVRGSGEEWGLEDLEVVDNIIRGDILFAIAQHDFEFAHISEVGSLAEILILADELEEFSRYGRQLLSRQYFDTVAESGVAFRTQKTKSKKNIDVEIRYEVAAHHSLTDFFQHKTEQLCRFYSLKAPADEQAGQPEHYRIRRIRITAEKGNSSMWFELSRDSVDRGCLPATTVGERRFDKGERNMICRDDKLYIETDSGTISLENWLHNAPVNDQRTSPN